jgi:PAS domain S-box-containing protein
VLSARRIPQAVFLAYDGLSVIVCRHWKSTFCLALVVQASAICFAAEHYVFDVFDQERGLGDTVVTRLARDRRGALWVGTDNGLYRYDGHRFLAFTKSDGLPGNKITAIHESPDGTLWVGTLEGLAWRAGAGFRKSSHEALKGYIPPQGIASDATGRVFIATPKGVAVTSPPTPGRDLQVTFLPWPVGIPQRSSNVYVPSPDEVWFDCDVAICRWNGKDVQMWGRDAGVPLHHWDFFLKDKSDNLWARNRDSFIELAAGTNRFQPIGPDLPGPISIPAELAMDDKGRILVPDNHGLVIGGPGGWRRVTEKQGLPQNFVTAVLQDSEGSMWLGTYGAGLARWAGYDAWQSFTVMEGLAGNAIASVLEDPHTGMWVGTTAGLSHGVFSKDTWNWSEVSIPGVGWVSSLARAKDGALWMLTAGHFVVRYDPISRRSRRLGPFGEGPFQIRADSAGRLWIADSGSVRIGSAPYRVQDFEKLRPPAATESTLFTATVEDTRGDLWIGSMSGLFRRAQGTWFRYDTGSGLCANRIVDLALSPEGDIWVAYFETKGTDRIRAVGDSIEVEHFDRSKGLTSDRVNSVGFDRRGQIWILNDSGVEVRRGNTWVQFSLADGMISSGATGRAFCASADGAIWMGGARGLSRYMPVETAGTPLEPIRVSFSEVRIGNTTLDPELGALVEATPQPFEAKFSALLLAHGPEVRYRYRIVGFDDGWQETARPEAQFDYLPPGQYRLEVQARRDVQPWSGPAATLALEVRPRWYGTTLFRGMLVASVCVALGFLARYRQKTVAARQALKRIVDQRTAELRESEERFRNMANTAPVMIWVTDSDKLGTFFNKRWLEFRGRTMEQELGLGWAEGVHPDDVEAFMATYSSAFKMRSEFQTEKRLCRADGEYRSLLCTGVPRFTESGVFAGYVGCSIDITELRRTQEQALATQKLESVGVLAGGIAHDFNNLLGSILADSELLLGDLACDSPARDGIQRIQAVAVRAAEIVRELMAYAGQENTVLEPVDISKLVGEMLQLMKVSISKRALLQVDLPEKLPAVRANAAQMRQVIMNLITNASEALGDREGVISVTMGLVPSGRESFADRAPSLSHGGCIRLEVSDTGCGMTEEIQARIFDPFFTTKFAGRGLGLASVQGIIRRHNGVINVVSAPGGGSRFEIVLPCTDQPAVGAPSIAVPASAEEPERVAGTVLVVEDEDSLRVAVSKALRKQGFSVIEAGDGRTGVDLFLANEPDIGAVLLDMTLPGMKGPEVFAELRRIRPGVKIVLTTAYSQEMVSANLGGQQPWAFIRKPYQIRELVNLLRDACRQNRGTSGCATG